MGVTRYMSIEERCLQKSISDERARQKGYLSKQTLSTVEKRK